MNFLFRLVMHISYHNSGFYGNLYIVEPQTSW